MGLGDTSLTWRVAFFFMILGFIMTLAGICSTYIAAAEPIPNKERHIGFWDICDDTQTYACIDMIMFVNSQNRDPAWVHGLRALTLIGFIILGLNILFSLWISLSIASVNNKIGNLISGVVSILSVALTMTGTGVYMDKSIDLLEDILEMDADPSWSLAVIMSGNTLVFIAACMLIYKAFVSSM